jgi:hypothetical protein
MSMLRTSCLLLLLVTGCNSFYGLDETRTNSDGDGDGVLDKEDNCPTVPNADQMDSNPELRDGGDACAQCGAVIGIDLDADLYDDGCDRCLGPGHPRGAALIDTDGDKLDDRCDPCLAGKSAFEIDFNENGIGDGCEVCFEMSGVDVDADGLDDACDGCLKGPPHDEDGDGIDDACDNCPFDPNADQSPSIDAPVGDVCQRATISPLERLVFDPFLVRDLFRWNAVSGVWTIANDRATLSNGGRRTLGARFKGEFRFVTRVHLTGDEDVIVELKSPTLLAECKVTSTGAVTFGGEAAQLPITGPLTIDIYHSSANIIAPLRCEVRSGTASVELATDPPADEIRITIHGAGAQGTLAIEAVDLVRAVPLPVPF